MTPGVSSLGIVNQPEVSLPVAFDSQMACKLRMMPAVDIAGLRYGGASLLPGCDNSPPSHHRSGCATSIGPKGHHDDASAVMSHKRYWGSSSEPLVDIDSSCELSVAHSASDCDDGFAPYQQSDAWSCGQPQGTTRFAFSSADSSGECSSGECNRAQDSISSHLPGCDNSRFSDWSAVDSSGECGGAQGSDLSAAFSLRSY